MDQDGLCDVLVRGLLLADAVDVLEVLPQGEARDAHDVCGHRGGEEQRLPRPLRGQHVEHLRDGGPEAHFQQLVRLVEDHHAQALRARLLKIFSFVAVLAIHSCTKLETQMLDDTDCTGTDRFNNSDSLHLLLQPVVLQEVVEPAGSSDKQVRRLPLELAQVTPNVGAPKDDLKAKVGKEVEQHFGLLGDLSRQFSSKLS